MKKNLIFFCFLNLCANAQMRSYYAQVPYEPCSCLNHSYTQQLLNPYREQIQTWAENTRPKYHPPTFTREVCYASVQRQPLEEDTPARPHSSPLWEFLGWHTDTEEEEKPLSRPDFIPSLCFYASSKMTRSLPHRKGYYACLYNHYAGSEAFPSMCWGKNTEAKKCWAIPLPCEDTQNPYLSCPEEFVSRRVHLRASGCNKGSVYPRKPCLNREYVALTATVFHDVARCLQIPYGLAFAIFHHESRFVINSQSHTGALCYGQITGAAAADFNSFLDEKPHYKDIKALLPENILAQCPDTWKHFQRVKVLPHAFHRRLHIPAQDKCLLTLNPYTCFFYGFAYIKILLHKSQKAIEEMNNIEVAVYKDQIFIFWGEKEKRVTEKKLNHIFQTEKIKIFRNEEALKHLLVIVGYNGGPVLYGVLFKKFIARLKKTLSDPKNQSLRHSLIYTGLKISFFIDEFTSFIKEHYPSRRYKRRKEVAEYIKKVHQDMEFLNHFLNTHYRGLPEDICSFPHLLKAL